MTSAVDVIRTKRDGGELSDADIAWVLRAYVAGEVATLDQLLCADGQALDGAADRAGDGSLHLHGLDRGDGSSEADLLANLDRE